MIFVVVLKLFEGVLKVFVGADFRIKRAHRTQKWTGEPKSLLVALQGRLTS